jgi:hypothetical protein
VTQDLGERCDITATQEEIRRISVTQIVKCKVRYFSDVVL